MENDLELSNEDLLEIIKRNPQIWGKGLEKIGKQDYILTVDKIVRASAVTLGVVVNDDALIGHGVITIPYELILKSNQ